MKWRLIDATVLLFLIGSSSGTYGQSEDRSGYEHIADPALKAWAKLASDTNAAGSFTNHDVAVMQPAREDERLRFVEGRELAFGYAQACRTDNDCRAVFVRPVGQIARYWLRILQTDWEEFQRLASRDANGPPFVAKLKAAYQKSDSVWMHAAKLYCELEPQGFYKDFDGAVVSCTRSQKGSGF